LNDSLSSAIFDAYLKSLDNNRSYFLASDVQSFEKYRLTIDDLTRKEDVNLAYEIYNAFAKRSKERMDYVLNTLVSSNFDFTTDEYYETERENEPWAKTQAELNDIWRKIIKSQALSLKLANKTNDEIKETLKKRYERFAKTITQFNTEDVFGFHHGILRSTHYLFHAKDFRPFQAKHESFAGGHWRQAPE
jgi:carboxyl-terminal processing protease